MFDGFGEPDLDQTVWIKPDEQYAPFSVQITGGKVGEGWPVTAFGYLRALS